MEWRFFWILLLLVPMHVFADGTVEYQKRLSKVPPEKRLEQLEKDLNPATEIGSKDVDDWQRDKQLDKCLQDEVQYLGIEQTLLKAWQESWENGSASSFNELLAEKGQFQYPADKSLASKKTYSDISIYELSDKNNSVTRWDGSFLKSYSKISSAEIIGMKYLISEKERSSKNLNFNSAQIEIRYDIRGFNKEGYRLNDRGTMAVQVSFKNNKWIIEGNKVLSGERVVANREPAFIERTSQSSLNKVSIHERSEAIRRGGYAISVNDINGDGFLDIYSGSAKLSQLLYGAKDGTWNIVNESILSSLSAVKTAIFADFDNDGDSDAIMTLFEYDKDDSDLAYLINNNGKFTPVKNFVKGKLNYNLPMPATVADFDRDGFLDLYVGFPGKRDFTVLDSATDKKFEYPQGFFRNLANKSKDRAFVDATKAAWGKKGLSKYTSVFPHSSIATDYDFDGDMDLLVVDDRSNLSPLYENQSGKGFTPVNDLVDFKNKGYGMGVAIGDLNNDGVNDIAITNVNFYARQRFNSSCNANWYFDFPSDPGIKIFSGHQSGEKKKISFSDITSSTNASFVGEGAAGIEFLDYNNDGLLDIYVATGLWSGENKDKKYDLSSLFTRAVAAKKTYNDVLEPYRTYRQRDWSFVSILRDGKFKTAPSMAGYQRNRLFLNLGNNDFVEVGYLEGVDSIYDGYVIATGDPNKDGKIDLFLRNGDPGSLKYTYPTIQYFENHFNEKNHSITISLEGNDSNRNAIGSTVSVTTQSGKVIKRQLVANNGAAQSQMLLHFGLGADTKAKSVHIRWPSGKLQDFGPLKEGHYLIKEGFQPRLAAN